jgi:hypothetical protein
MCPRVTSESPPTRCGTLTRTAYSRAPDSPTPRCWNPPSHPLGSDRWESRTKLLYSLRCKTQETHPSIQTLAFFRPSASRSSARASSSSRSTLTGTTLANEQARGRSSRPVSFCSTRKTTCAPLFSSVRSLTPLSRAIAAPWQRSSQPNFEASAKLSCGPRPSPPPDPSHARSPSFTRVATQRQTRSSSVTSCLT